VKKFLALDAGTLHTNPESDPCQNLHVWPLGISLVDLSVKMSPGFVHNLLKYIAKCQFIT